MNIKYTQGHTSNKIAPKVKSAAAGASLASHQKEVYNQMIASSGASR
jgi:hypothetical protein